MQTVGGLIKRTPTEGVKLMTKIIVRVVILTPIILLALSRVAA